MNLKLDHHTRGKWFIHGPKHRKENQLLSLKPPCWLKLLILMTANNNRLEMISMAWCKSCTKPSIYEGAERYRYTRYDAETDFVMFLYRASCPNYCDITPATNIQLNLSFTDITVQTWFCDWTLLHFNSNLLIILAKGLNNNIPSFCKIMAWHNLLTQTCIIWL